MRKFPVRDAEDFKTPATGPDWLGLRLGLRSVQRTSYPSRMSSSASIFTLMERIDRKVRGRPREEAWGGGIIKCEGPHPEFQGPRKTIVFHMFSIS
jgi:hypothetical protein